MVELQLKPIKAGVGDTSDKHERAFQDLQSLHGERLRRFCLRLCAGNADVAADVEQETWLAAYQSLPRFAHRAKMTTWLLRIAVYRWRQMRVTLSDVPLGEDDAPSTPDAAPATLDRLALEGALLTLSDAQREAFLLVKAEQFTHKEAAAILDVPQGTVQARVHEAVRRLRLVLTEPEETHDVR